MIVAFPPLYRDFSVVNTTRTSSASQSQSLQFIHMIICPHQQVFMYNFNLLHSSPSPYTCSPDDCNCTIANHGYDPRVPGAEVDISNHDCIRHCHRSSASSIKPSRLTNIRGSKDGSLHAHRSFAREFRTVLEGQNRFI